MQRLFSDGIVYECLQSIRSIEPSNLNFLIDVEIAILIN